MEGVMPCPPTCEPLCCWGMLPPRRPCPYCKCFWQLPITHTGSLSLHLMNLDVTDSHSISRSLCVTQVKHANHKSTSNNTNMSTASNTVWKYVQTVAAHHSLRWIGCLQSVQLTIHTSALESSQWLEDTRRCTNMHPNTGQIVRYPVPNTLGTNSTPRAWKLSAWHTKMHEACSRGLLRVLWTHNDGAAFKVHAIECLHSCCCPLVIKLQQQTGNRQRTCDYGHTRVMAHTDRLHKTGLHCSCSGPW